VTIGAVIDRPVSAGSDRGNRLGKRISIASAESASATGPFGVSEPENAGHRPGWREIAGAALPQAGHRALARGSSHAARDLFEEQKGLLV